MLSEIAAAACPGSEQAATNWVRNIGKDVETKIGKVSLKLEPLMKLSRGLTITLTE